MGALQDDIVIGPETKSPNRKKQKKKLTEVKIVLVTRFSFTFAQLTAEGNPQPRKPRVH